MTALWGIGLGPLVLGFAGLMTWLEARKQEREERAAKAILEIGRILGRDEAEREQRPA